MKSLSSGEAMLTLTISQPTNVEYPVAAIRVKSFLDCMVIRERAGESKKIERVYRKWNKVYAMDKDLTLCAF
jgi:hypothetical protein